MSNFNGDVWKVSLPKAGEKYYWFAFSICLSEKGNLAPVWGSNGLKRTLDNWRAISESKRRLAWVSETFSLRRRFIRLKMHKFHVDVDFQVIHTLWPFNALSRKLLSLVSCVITCDRWTVYYANKSHYERDKKQQNTTYILIFMYVYARIESNALG